MKGKAIFLNMISSGVAFALQFGISFFLTPYIVESLSAEAYGFISLANSFPSYALLVTSALNAMASRFLSIEIYQGNRKKANMYYSSVVVGNVVMTAVLAVLCAFFIPNANRIIEVPDYLLKDVQILLSIVFFNFLVQLCTTLSGISLHIENKLYLSSMRSMEATVLRTAITVALFLIFPPKIYYIALASTIEMVYTLIWNFHYRNKFLPYLKVKRSDFNFKAVIQLLSAGVWSVVSRLGGMLTSGLDLLLCNLLVSAAEMGALSISKTLPALVLTFINIIAGAYSPTIIKTYAQKSSADVAEVVKSSMRTLSALLSIIVGGIIAFGDVFFELWVPGQDAGKLYILCTVSMLAIAFSSAIGTANNVIIAANKVKGNSLAVLFFGLANTMLAFLLLKFTNLGVYAIVIVSTVTSVMRDTLFVLPYAAKCIGMKWHAFFSPLVKNLFACAFMVFMGILIKTAIPIHSWGTFILAAGICAIAGLFANLFIVLTKTERKTIAVTVLRALK